MNSYTGRFAPSPSGRMHLGNIYAALIAWLFARHNSGAFLLRIEDIDKARCKSEYTEALIADLTRLGISFDEEKTWYQSERSQYYEKALAALREKGLLYPCFCTRADLHASAAPHEADGRSIYSGKCSTIASAEAEGLCRERPYSLRCRASLDEYFFKDDIFGTQKQCPALDWGDFTVRRADGAYAYQLCAAVDDAESGVNHIVRGRDLLSSVCAQEFLKGELGYSHASYAHIPLLLAPDGKRLSKREKSLDAGELFKTNTPQQLIGKIAYLCKLIDTPSPLTCAELTAEFSPDKLTRADITVYGEFF